MYRNQGITGSNNIPLGNRRRFGGDNADDGGYNPAQPSTGMPEKRGRSPTQDTQPPIKRRRNRWGDAKDNKAAGLMGLPTKIEAAMTPEQIDAYVLHLRIEEITQKLKINDVVPSDRDRSPSPPPQYDNFGRRVNTRDFRYKKKLEDERHALVEQAMQTFSNYQPPVDYRRPTKTQEKVYVPVNDYPEINFIGLLIGPRGNTLKKMESESGAKIAIRGKGSVKEGKGRSDTTHTSNQEEDLHCLIMADTEDKVNKAKKLIHNVIETAASIPEGQNELKRNQLRELAALNGTLRDDENQACQNCGEIGHRKYDCPKKTNFTATIICRICGEAGHMARDCGQRKKGQDWRNDDRGYGGRHAGAIANGASELDQFMSGLGGGAGGRPQAIEYSAENNDRYDNEQSEAKPWERGSGGPAPWHSSNNSREDRDGGSAPWASNSGNGANTYYAQGGYNAGAGSWNAASAASYGYGSYSTAGYDGYQGATAGAPGMSGYGAPGYSAPPPGLNAYNYYGGSGASPPPPPPPGGAGEVPPPPPPGGEPVPPPPPPA